MATGDIPSASPEPARRGPAFLIVATLLCAIVIVDPVREFMSQDDGWAYARSVEHLLRTGEYRLDAWSAASNPVQIYLAAGLAEMFGYSLSLLRVSTLMLLIAGLAALYGLLRRGSLPAWPAAILTKGAGEALDPGWKAIADVPYPSATFALRSFQVLQRQTPQPAEAEPCPTPAVSP